MVIEINKDIDRYKETVIMGLTAKQLVFSVASVMAGSGIVLLLYPLIGLTPSVYVAIPAVAPIALGGFYSFNGMGFYEFMGRKLRMTFANHPLVYVSTEGNMAILEDSVERGAFGMKPKKGKRKEQENPVKEDAGKEEFEAMKKKTGKVFAWIAVAVVAAVIGLFFYKAGH